MMNFFFFSPKINPDLSNWDVSKVTNMKYAFSGLVEFTGDLSKWDVSSAKTMKYMFYKSLLFNQDLSSWCVGSFTSEPNSFSRLASSWTLPKPVWGTCPARL